MEAPDDANPPTRTMVELLQESAAVALVAAGELGEVAEAWESAAVVDDSPLSVELGAACVLLTDLVEQTDSMDSRECLAKAAAAVHIAGVAAALAGKCFERLAQLSADPTTEAGQAAAATGALEVTS